MNGIRHSNDGSAVVGRFSASRSTPIALSGSAICSLGIGEGAARVDRVGISSRPTGSRFARAPLGSLAELPDLFDGAHTPFVRCGPTGFDRVANQEYKRRTGSRLTIHLDQVLVCEMKGGVDADGALKAAERFGQVLSGAVRRPAVRGVVDQVIVGVREGIPGFGVGRIGGNQTGETIPRGDETALR